MTAAAGSARRASAGFTLLETLVALAILGLILAFYGGSLRLMLGAVARQTVSVDAAGDRAATAAALRRMLENLRPGGPPAILEAGPHRLRFATSLPGVDGPVDAVLERDAGGRLMLLWSRAPHVRPLAPLPRPTATELIDGVAGLDLSYWRGNAWVTALPAGQVPALVRLHLTPSSGAPGADIVVAPRVDPPAAP